MLTFEQYVYERPNMEQLKAAFQTLLSQFREADSFELQSKIMKELSAIFRNFSTQENLMYIRSSIDTNDAFYAQEREYFDQIGPEFQSLQTEYYKALVVSPFRRQLEDQWGTLLFSLADHAIQSFSEAILPLLQQENMLVSEYAKLVASAQIDFDGKTLTLAQLAPYMESMDRSVRKEAMNASANFYATHEAKFDDLFDQLVKIRHQIATALGFKNFVELGYIRMNRVDYDAEMVEIFRKQVRDVIVPLASKLRSKQAKRIGLDQLKFYDEALQFPKGNPQPNGSSDWIVQNGKKMYEELSAETGHFFNYMLDKHLMDLDAKKGKEAGGYCTFIDDYNSPFIFSNFNGTSDDIDVLTHEAGHAFQVFSSREIGIPEYVWPTSESAEIHSMSMEFFTWPWMELFFDDQADQYRFAHMSSGLLFLPYGAAVDEFQHRIYENPDMTPTERKALWRSLEQTYLPTRDYDGQPYLESGGYWQRQAHIYEVPFYYIDYTLAQICAFQFWQRSLTDRSEAWNDYVHLCRLGGSKSFTELIKEANLQSPFEEGTVQSVAQTIDDWLTAAENSI